MMNNENQDDKVKKTPKWSFCPVCGVNIPKIEKLRYCLNCGLDLLYTKENKEFPPGYNPIQKQAEEQYLGYTFGPYRGMIDEKDIINKRDQKNWGVTATFGITALSYLFMLLAGILIMLPFVALFYGNLSSIYSPYFLILTSLAEFTLIIIPIRYVGKYLRQPTLKNRLSFLGFSTEEFEKGGVYKEISIGLGFAILGVFLVGITSVAIELFVKYAFGIEFIYSSSDIDLFIRSADGFSIVLIAVTMIVCVGFSEEILFRGFMQRGLTKNLGVKTGIIINALIFALIHIFTVFTYLTEAPQIFISIFLSTFVPYFAVSLMLSYLFYWRKENLIAVIVAHGVYDAITIVIAYIFLNSF